MNTATVAVGLDCYLATATGGPVPSFPDTGPAMDEVYLFLAGDPVAALAATGLGDDTPPPDALTARRDETNAAFEARELDHLRQAPVGPGIALFKLSCRREQGWWVTATECAHALTLWADHGHQELPDGLAEFLARGAAGHGFRVWQAH